jgi:predicted ATP-binding protein involved in virulence
MDSTMSNNAVRVASLELNNFRGFKTLKLAFSDKPIVVFFGENGAGKSTILEAINFALANTVDFLLHGKNRFSPMLEYDAVGHDGNEVNIMFSLDAYGEVFTISYQDAQHFSNDELNEMEDWIENDKFSSFRTSPKEKNRLWSAKVPVDNIKFRSRQPRQQTEALVKHLQTNFSKKSLPLFLYYSANRFVNPSSSNTADKFDPLANIREQDAYKDAFQATTHFNDFFNWYKLLEDRENEEKSRILTEILNNNKSIEDYQGKELKTRLNFIRKAIYCFIPYLDNIRVNRIDSHKIKVLVQKNQQEYDLQQLSQGEKMLLALVGDIALRLVILNPKAADPLAASGVILIDEIDLHLHPIWQRRILNNLHRTFPNCQFIVTTHSPQVLGETNEADVFFLSRNANDELEVEKAEYIYGKNSDDILEYFMGTSSRNKTIQTKLNRLLDSIQDGHLQKAEKQLIVLEETLGINDIELMKARLLLKKMRIRHAKNKQKS